MDSILTLIHYTVTQHIRHKIYLSVFMFALALLGGGMVVSTLAAEEQMRLLVDLGLAGIEFLSLVAVIFLTVNLVLEEMESRSLYLILSHPIERWQYILGRFLGTLLALVAAMLIMSVLHMGLLFIKGWSWNNFYLIALGCSIAKISIVGALALLVSLITTSTASSMSITIFLWVLGHFSSELKFMAEKSSSVMVKSFIWIFQHVTPDFNYFNYKDFWRAIELPPVSWYGWMGVYTFGYIGMALILSSWMFARREF